MRVLDLGCGVGGPARTIAREIGCTIVGITNSAWHVARGTALTKEAGLDHLITLVHGDFQARMPSSPLLNSPPPLSVHHPQKKWTDSAWRR